MKVKCNVIQISDITTNFPDSDIVRKGSSGVVSRVNSKRNMLLQ